MNLMPCTGIEPVSLPLSGEWIEIIILFYRLSTVKSLSLSGEWIEVLLVSCIFDKYNTRINISTRI